jgi:hypothetical protein
MSYISYLPPKGYPDQLSITLMDGRSVRLVEGRHQYGAGVVERLHQTLSSNSTLGNLIASQVLRLELDNPPPQHMSMYSTGGQYMGDISTNDGSVANAYRTDVQSAAHQPPPLGATMATMPGYYPQSGPVPGVTGAPPYAPVNDNLNQYTLDGVVQPLNLSPNNTVVTVNNPDDIFRFQATPTGNVSPLRENGQLTPEEESRVQYAPQQQYAPPVVPQQQYAPPAPPAPQQQQYAPPAPPAPPAPQQQQYTPPAPPAPQQQYVPPVTDMTIPPVTDGSITTKKKRKRVV